jgi:hypothetical protein
MGTFTKNKKVKERETGKCDCKGSDENGRFRAGPLILS